MNTMLKPVVLVVDDDADIRDALSMVLEEHGFHCITAANGAAGLEYLRYQPVRPDLVLLDLMMPVMDGWEFRRQQLADPALASIPVVVLTAAGEVGRRAAETGISRALRKPVKMEALLDALGEQVPRWQRPG